jgi:hypothetical protein
MGRSLSSGSFRNSSLHFTLVWEDRKMQRDEIEIFISAAQEEPFRGSSTQVLVSKAIGLAAINTDAQPTHACTEIVRPRLLNVVDPGVGAWNPPGSEGVVGYMGMGRQCTPQGYMIHLM